MICCVLILLTACTCDCSTPRPPCLIDGLLIDITDLPGRDWTETGSRSSEDAPMRLGDEKTGTSFVSKGLLNGVVHEIYRENNEKSAYRAYIDIEEEYYPMQRYRNEWGFPVEMSKILLSANYQRIGCNIHDKTGAEECRFLAQYGTYLVRFSIRLNDLQYSDVINIIEMIDKKMVECNSDIQDGENN